MSAAPNLTLHNIETSLIELFAFRDEVARDPDITPQEQVESLKAIDTQIEQYVAAELDKADGIAHNLHEFEVRMATCQAEAKREQDRAKMWEAHYGRLANATLKAMQARGTKKIETARTTLKIAKNPASVEVFDSSAVPKPYLRRMVTLNADLYDRIAAHLMGTKDGAPLFSELLEAKTTQPEAMKTEIAKELKAGVAVDGCKLIDDRVRLVVE